MSATAQWHPTSEQLLAFDRGLLPRGQRGEIERHLAECMVCCASLDTASDDDFVELLRSSLRSESTFADRFHSMLKADTTNSNNNPPNSQEIPAALANHPRYEVLGILGSGGMGTVFKARHRVMDRLVALKVIRPDRLDRPGAVERFEREVKAAARLSHENIVASYDAEHSGDIHFLVMEYVNGTSLDRLIGERGPLPVSEACRLVQQAARGLQYAFDQGMIHRDIKPANLMITPHGQLKILDFGLARLMCDATGAASPDETRTTTDLPLTQTGTIMGTPDYIAPELTDEADKANIRSDVYSLGCTFYHMLCGHPPFPGGTTLQKLMFHRESTPSRLDELCRQVPAELANIVERMLAKDPAQRFSTPGEVADALEAFLTKCREQESNRRRLSLATKVFIAGAALAIVLLGLILWSFATGWGSKKGNNEATKIAKKKSESKVKKKPSLRTRLIEWVKENNQLGPNHAICKDVARQYDQGVKPGEAFVFSFGAGLMRSGRATFVAGRNDSLYVFMPKHYFVPERMMVLQVTAPQDQEFGDRPVVQLGKLAIDNADNFNIRGKVNGSVRLRQTGKVEGKVALRMTVMLGPSTQTLWRNLTEKELAAGGKITFAFPPIWPDGQPPSGKAFVVLDAAIVHAPGRKSKAYVISNDVATMLYLQPTGPAEGG